MKADQIGIATGECIAQNAALAKKLDSLRDQLMQKVTDVRISITYFQNWASTDAALLLHAKPKTREQVVNLVTVAKDLGIKVSSYHKPIFTQHIIIKATPIFFCTIDFVICFSFTVNVATYYPCG